MTALARIFKTPELRNGLLFILGAVTIFRVVAHIPVPGIDASGLEGLLAGNQFLGLLNVFSGGTLENFSIVALGVAPYITASIIFQLLGMIFPSVEEMQKEEQGRQKLNRYTRFATVPLAVLQGYSLVMLLTQQGVLNSGALSTLEFVTAIGSMVAGTVFLMWLGELISERKLGNGISIMIFAGIVSAFPGFIAQTVATYTSADLINVIVFAALTVATVVSVVVISEAQRNLPVQYARGGRNQATKVVSTLPLRVNMGGMIPILFALSIIVLPPLVAQFFVNARTEVIRTIAVQTIALFGNSAFYALFYFALVVTFTFFYASVVFKPDQVAENLQKQGGFIPGVRPGEPTANYLQWVMNRLLLIGAVFLATLAILPVLVQEFTGNVNLVVGGSSVLIVVSVVIDIVKQIDSQLTMRSYDDVV
ncbi:preprotein translocase subunit SecY [Patescibacteria group bacterium]|nr:preprotein translocase subunit SecY [Patescibacteria group bacterium]